VERSGYEARVERDHDECRVVLSGEIDLVAVPDVFARIQEADREGADRLVVLMTDVTLIDSSGIGVLARLAAAQVQMEIRGATGVVRRAIDISGVALSPNIRMDDDSS
jgi:anti-anti-sigma factor